jgi:2,3-bisphosphoglycerate-independent phosphoglycerate mutase
MTNQMATIEEGDVVIFFNFRTDRGRELTGLKMDLHEHAQIKLILCYADQL